MGRCLYCDQPAWFLRVQHAECSARYRRAMSMMPTFFAKYLESQVPAERFSELLAGAARAAFVSSEELASLSVAEIGKTVDLLLERGAPSMDEIQRISELMDQMGSAVADDAGLNEKLVKATVIAELDEGKIPDAVTVAGPLPIKLGRGENVLWIFNRVEAYRAPPQDADLNPLTELGGRGGRPRASVDGAPAPASGEEMLDGDLVVTDRCVHLLPSMGANERFPIAAISSMRTYANGIQFSVASKGGWIFLLDDPSFAANVIGRLGRLSGEVA